MMAGGLWGRWEADGWWCAWLQGPCDGGVLDWQRPGAGGDDGSPPPVWRLAGGDNDLPPPARDRWHGRGRWWSAAGVAIGGRGQWCSCAGG